MCCVGFYGGIRTAQRIGIMFELFRKINSMCMLCVHEWVRDNEIGERDTEKL